MNMPAGCSMRQDHGGDVRFNATDNTAAALVSERARATLIGMNDFVTKPIDPARLRAALLRVLGSPQDTTPTPLA
jgi:CheY-like chemotaxis protein